jgi:hypothetical protein
MDDDAVLEAQLRHAIRLFDPPPASTRAAAEAAFTMRAMDAEIALLTFDSHAAADAVRGGAPSRLLTFTAGAVSVDVELRQEAEPYIIGRLDHSGETRVDVRTPTGVVTVTTDTLGRFRTGPLGNGPYSLRCDLEPDERDIVTDWFC